MGYVPPPPPPNWMGVEASAWHYAWLKAVARRGLSGSFKRGSPEVDQRDVDDFIARHKDEDRWNEPRPAPAAPGVTVGWLERVFMTFFKEWAVPVAVVVGIVLLAIVLFAPRNGR